MKNNLINSRHPGFLLCALLMVSISTVFTFCNNAGTASNTADNTLLAEPLGSGTGSENINTKNAKLVAAQMAEANKVQATLVGNPRKLPVYGFNGNISRGPSYGNKAFRDSVASLGLKAIRYPGGSVSSFWDWKKGWFVEGQTEGVQKTKELYNKASTQENENGLNKLKLLVDEAKCDVVFTLNMVTKTLDDQVDMLKNAQSLGIPVKWIELGNEFNLQKNPAKQKFNTAEVYGKVCNQWITRLKQQFPNAKIAVVGGNRTYNNDVKNWNNTVLRNAPNADAVVAHVYASAAKVVDASGINYESLYNAFTTGFDDGGFNNIKNKGIWVTEYNILWALSSDKSATANIMTWGQALGALLMTSTLTDLSDEVQVILNHNIANSNAFAAIETENNTFKKLPNGIGMQEWFTAINQMTDLQKISFNQGGGKINDYELFGWKFSNTQGRNNVLVCNLTANANTVALAQIIGSKAANYNMKYADKKTDISSVKERSGRLNNANALELPPYSVAIVSNQ